jgi:surfeit locus 1 family protein
MANNLQFCFHKQTYQLNLKIGFTILCLFFFILFCVLGVWQLHRFSYKKNLLIAYQQRLADQPKSLNEIMQSTDSIQFQPLRVEGYYKNDATLIMQNQFHHGQDGFEIITPLQINNQKKLLLVDRGWVKKTKNGLPKIIAIKEKQTIIGHVKELNEYQFILGKNILEKTSSYLVIQKVDINELHHATNQDYYPFILRLDASQSNGFVRDWTLSNIMPERHMGYAIQWFIMAFVLVIAYLCFCCEKVKNEKLA